MHSVCLNDGTAAYTYRMWLHDQYPGILCSKYCSLTMVRSYLRPALLISLCCWPAATVCCSPPAMSTRPPAAPLCPLSMHTMLHMPACRTSHRQFQVTLRQLQTLSSGQWHVHSQQLQGLQQSQTQRLPHWVTRPEMPPLQHPAAITVMKTQPPFPPPQSALLEIAGTLPQRIPLISPRLVLHHDCGPASQPLCAAALAKHEVLAS